MVRERGAYAEDLHQRGILGGCCGKRPRRRGEWGEGGGWPPQRRGEQVSDECRRHGGGWVLPARQLNWRRRCRCSDGDATFGSRVAARDSDKRRQLSALADAWSHGSCCPVPASGPPPPVERHRRCTARSRRAGAQGAVPRLRYTPAPVALHPPLGRLVSCCSCRLSSVVPISGVFVPSPFSPTP